MNDWELIQNYCRNGSESAFETLVKRHVDYVYCAALRQVRDPSLAEDVSQAVFMLLARKAKSFRSGTVLVSWLFRTTHYIAERALRSEFRRQRRETEAAKMNPTTTTPEIDQQWERVSPVLDEALAALSNKDRDAVLLRFISQKPFNQVGAKMGVSEDAAKKRVARALARLREFFVRRGTTLSVMVIAVLLGERTVQASPAALATKITAAVGVGASGAATTTATALLKATLRDLFWTKVRWGAAISAGLVVALWLGSTAVRPAYHQARIPASSAPPVAKVQASADSTRVAADAAAENQNATNHILRLLVERMEDRQPIAGARVLVDCWTPKQAERAFDAMTDSNGLLNIPIPHTASDLLIVWVSAEDRVPMCMRWKTYEFNEPVLSHTLLLEAGQTASGTVLDEWGEPVPGATISFNAWESGGSQTKRDYRQFNPELSALYTDANGRWTTSQFPPPTPRMGANILVTSPDYTPATVRDSGSGFPTNVVIVLSNGVALSGRITSADGKPIPNAEVSGASMSKKTGADGGFSWPHVEPGKVFLEIEAKGYEKLEDFVWATNAVNECAFTLKPSSNPAVAYASSEVPKVQLHGTVVDAETGEPIPAFKVLIGQNLPGPNWGNDAIILNGSLLGEGRDGRFNWQLSPGGGYRMQVEAEGYLPSLSKEIDGAVDQEFSFKLQRPTILTGRVVTPDGAPAENADVTFTGPNMGADMQKPGQLIQPNRGFEDARTRTDREGKFRLKLKLGADGIAIVHPSGTALLTFATATNDTIVLQRWGAIEGTLYLNGQPASNQTISVSGTQKADADEQIMFSADYQTTTDEHGHFRFDQVLPGEHSVERWVGMSDSGPSSVNPDQSAQVKVESGAVATVELRRQGRPVIGRIKFQGRPDDVYWGMSEAVLTDSKRGFPFALSKDGAMRAEDVPPGTYTLSIHLDAASVIPQEQLGNEKTFGSLEKQVVVPSSEDETVPVDLGELMVERAK